jgi:RNA polymerase sigma-70 factor (ECF subfamily)
VLAHDQQIIQDIRGGKEGPFRELFNTYYEGLCQYAFTILRDMDEAEDIVQAMFIKIWEKRQSLIITHTVKSYLYKAVYHQCINQFDHRAVREKYQEMSLIENSGIQLPEVFPNELEDRIVTAINSLPKQCRTIFMMSRYQEMKYSEIAKALELSVNTIENQISKALRILRTHLDDENI